MVSDLIDGFDHAIVGVKDIEAARLSWQRLGFTTCPRGKHIGWGTANYCIMFADDYVELLGIVDASQFTNNLDTLLAEQGEGLLGMAFASSHIDDLAQKLDGQAQYLKRLLELTEGTVEPHFKLVHPPKGTMPGLSGFFVNHLTPELMRQPEWLVHANGATGIASITLGLTNIPAAREVYIGLFGEDFVNDFINIVAGEAGFSRLSLKVDDLYATRIFLSDAQVSFAESDDGLSVAPEKATGAILSFVPGLSQLAPPPGHHDDHYGSHGDNGNGNMIYGCPVEKVEKGA